MKRIALLLALSAGACSAAPDLAPVAGQGLFTVIAWNDTFGQTDKAPPIEWRHDVTACGEGGSMGYQEDGLCKGGNWVSGDSFVTVADQPDFRVRSEFVAHEYLHVYLARVGRDDPDHRQPEWQPGGLLERANDALAKAGW